MGIESIYTPSALQIVLLCVRASRGLFRVPFLPQPPPRQRRIPPSCYTSSHARNEGGYKTRVRTNTGKQTISYMASIFWHNIPPNLKNLNVYQFSKQIKLYLFSDQLENS